MCFFGRLESSIGMFQGWFGKLASSLVTLFSVVGGGSAVSVCGEFVEFRSFLVRVIWHSVPISESGLICFASTCFAVQLRTSRPRAKAMHALTRRLRSRSFHETEHRLLQLGIHFVGDGHHIEQDGAEIHTAKIVLQSIEDTDL